MKTLQLALGALVLVLAVHAAPGHAQYIYLDSNGDGVHTSADVLHGVGPTVVDIWLDIGHNRDGTPTVCQIQGGTSSTPLDMFSYQVSLEATGGTVSWSTFTNRITSMALATPPLGPDASRFDTGGYFMGAGSLPPGRYRLGTMTIMVATGTPRLDFVGIMHWNPPFDSYTMFGSQCDGTYYANSIMLGTNWFDQDGLAFDPGGLANQPPSIAPFPDPTVASGENLTQPLNATDPDGQPLTWTKASGPGYLFVATTDLGSGTAQGELRIAPFASNVGTAAAGVSVSDGTAADSRAFTVTVTSSGDHPAIFFAGPALTVIAGRTATRSLSGGDPDGATPHFSLISGPRFASLVDGASHPGGASATLRVAPSLCDVGTAVASVTISDGITATRQDIPVRVVPPSALPDANTHFSVSPSFGIALRVADMNGDGKLDAVVADEGSPGKVTVLFGMGDGSFGSAATYPVASSALDLTIADFDRNGTPDVVTANESAAGVSVLLGRGGGLLSPAVTYGTGQEPEGVAAADLNRDGILDLVTANQASETVSVLLGVGDGTFLPRRDSAAGARPASLAVADFNLDGRLDIAVGNKEGTAAITVLPGLGDGSFGDPIPTILNAFAVSISTADWNSDGVPDVAFGDFRHDHAVLLLGVGNGTFSAPLFLTVPNFTPYGSATDDFNGDGIPDLAVGDANNENVQVFLGNGNGGFGSPTVAGLGDMIAVGDANADGRPDFVATTPGYVYVRFNRFGPANPALSRAFVPADNRSITGGGNSDLVILVEPQGASYTSDVLDFSSFTLGSDGTGSVSLIHNVPAKRIISADRDNDGIPEIGVTFAKSDVASLFDQLHGRRTVVADLAGSLTDGRAFCTDVTLNILGKAATTQVASFAPNPLNPTSKLSFATEREGAARVAIFDIQGRMVRKLLDVPRLSAGPHELLFDGKSDRGAALASGVYFYRVESVAGRNEGQIVILK